ncbi:hypothetical protein AGMMS49532_03500 [Endomicrobiia bacterium]|nr:hypothetical protein AGMMS49532_03500 [Endomicrobiia bacterium]
MALTAVANIIGICGSMILTTSLWEVSSSSYWSEVLDFMRVSTFFSWFYKIGFFALIIAIILACMLHTKGGSEGIRRAATSSVMYSMVFILISDYFLTLLLITLIIK